MVSTIIKVAEKHSEHFFLSNATTCSYELRGFPSCCGDSVAEFWGWGAHEAQLSCPDVVSGDMYVKMYQDGPLSLSLLTTQTMGIFPYQEKFPL